MFWKWLLASLCLAGCQSGSQPSSLEGEEITQLAEAPLIVVDPQTPLPPPHYPWHDRYVSGVPRITKHYFHCKGSYLHPRLNTQDSKGRPLVLLDCDGPSQHGLMLREGREFIYPILIDLLNWIQEKTEKPVVITCGHRCPQHNTYVDASPRNQHSKHMIGAEVDFYVEGMEWEAEQIVQLLLSYYPEETFQRYQKEDAHVSTPPWFNKEVFIKLCQPNEERDLDNDHPYPYVNIQVRWDRDRGERVVYTWPQAHLSYLRR